MPTTNTDSILQSKVIGDHYSYLSTTVEIFGWAIYSERMMIEAMTREEAMKLMMEDSFQQEREAGAKWVRAQLTSMQLSTYCVGAVERFDLQRDIQRPCGMKFYLKTYHDRILFYGSAPVQHVRALVLNEPIPYQEK
jgi:uncharacterized protein (DUF885 family)